MSPVQRQGPLRPSASLADDPAMRSPMPRTVVALMGASYLLLALSFTYVHRYAGTFAVESLLWSAWALTGFGGALWHVTQGPPAGHKQWQWQGALGLLLAIFPGFLMFSLPRWVAFTLMLVMGARAAMMHTRRDAYIMLTVIFVVSFLVVTHAGSDWTLWVYLGPCWVLASLALTWLHTAGTRLSFWTKAAFNVGFVLLCLLLALLLHVLLPRPHIMGFGFLPPGTDQPGRWRAPAADGASGEDLKRQPTANAAMGGPTSENSGATGEWIASIGQLRDALNDRHIPAWQRQLLQSMTDGLETMVRTLSAAGSALQATITPAAVLLILLLLALLAWLWRYRWRVGGDLLLLAAGVLRRVHAPVSIRFSAASLNWALRAQGYRREAGQSVREHWGRLHDAPLLQQWLQRAADVYGASRFGNAGFTPAQAMRLYELARLASGVLLSTPRPR